MVISLPTDHRAHSAVGLSTLYKPPICSLKPPSWSGSPFTPRLRRRQDCPRTHWAERPRSVSCQMKIRLEDLNYFPYPSFASSSSCKAVSLIYDMMGPTYWDKHSILALQELPRRTVAILCFRFWGEENLTNGLFPWGMRKWPVWAAREWDDKGKETQTDTQFSKISPRIVQVANPAAACDPEDSCHWTALWAGSDLRASSLLPTLQAWHHFSRDLFCICSVNTPSEEKMPALWAAATQLGNWFLNTFLL